MEGRVMPFGKFKGAGIENLMIHQPQYLYWVATNTQFKFTEEELKRINDWHNRVVRSKKIQQWWDMAQRQRELKEERQHTSYNSHRGWEATDAWEAMAYEGVISPYGGDFM